VWRLCLYGATVYGWVWMRRRLLAREEDAQARRRLVRSEIAGVVAIVALEASLLMQELRGSRAMTLFTTDYLEYYLTLVSWIVNNGIWAVLVSSGVFALPFVAIIVQEWLKARAEGADEGNKGVLSARAHREPGLRRHRGGDVRRHPVHRRGPQHHPVRQLALGPVPGQRAAAHGYRLVAVLQHHQQPVGEGAGLVGFHARALARRHGASVAAIPCGTDLRQMRMEIDATRIDDPVLAQEVADFSRDCYGPARAKLFMQRPQLDEQQMHDVTWIGSRFFTDTGGYYDTYRSSTPRDDWPYDSTRDAGLAQVASGGGYPTCRQWWADGGNGLRARLLGQVDPNLLNRLAGWAGFLSRAEVDDSVIRAIASPRQQKLNQGSVYTDYGGQIDKTLPNIVTRATGDVGMAVGAIAAFPAMDVVRQSLPMVLALLKMALVICIPLVLVVGTYDLKTVVTVSVVQFALFFTDFWFQLARWIDSTILDALYGWGFGWNRPHTNFDPLVGLNNAFGDMLLMFVTGTMFIVLPTFWIMALAWAGVRAGNVLQGLAGATGDAKAAGGRGGSIAINAVSKK
jgi:hypothetical protein